MSVSAEAGGLIFVQQVDDANAALRGVKGMFGKSVRSGYGPGAAGRVGVSSLRKAVLVTSCFREFGVPLVRKFSGLWLLLAARCELALDRLQL